MKLLGFALLLTLTSAVHGELVKQGSGSYRTDLPPGPDGKPRRQIEADPLVSANITSAIPTNDWWSSLVWPMHSPHSMAMFPHPLAVQAHADGLAIGYTEQPVVSDHYKDGKSFQIGTNYRYPYRESLRIGLGGMETDATLLDGFSDWAVTGLWKKQDDELRATFAHGSPYVFFEKQSIKPIQITFTAAKVDPHREPVAPYMIEWKGITAKHSGDAAEFDLAINAGKNIGLGSKVRLVYDFDGDGKSDRTETFQLFPTDPSESTWEIYSSKKQATDPKLTRGEMRNFENGTIRFEFWKCFGKGSVRLDPKKSRLSLPDGSERPVGKDELVIVGAQAKPPGAAKVFYAEKNILGVELNGSQFGIFAPSGTSLRLKKGDTTDSLTSTLSGKGYLTVSALPDTAPATIEWFARYAFAFLRDTKIAYRYDQSKSTVETTFSVVTEAMEGENRETVFALYRHQHLHATKPDSFTASTFASPRGEMRILAGSGFTTNTPYLGILPALPNPTKKSDALTDSLKSDVEAIRFGKDDTYWNGKEFGKYSELIHIADQLGEQEIRDNLLGQLKSRMEDWFDGRERFFFYYDDRWDTLTGYPDSYGSAEQLNDHHFHYSYFIRAASTIAQFDPDWVEKDNYGTMIDTLIRDCANYDREDERFPWMRSFDPYAGHSWAAGHAGFASGNNQESSSESMNFASSLILYGQATGRDEIRDLGIYWHSTEAEAIRHYWFDQDSEVFPEGYAQSCVGMVWGDGASYGTWWTANPEEIHGINFLPLNGGSLYLGRDPDYVLSNLKNLKEANRNFHNGGFPGSPDTFDRWQDILAEYQALSDPAAASKQLESKFESELGESKTHTLQWIGAMQDLGKYDPTVRANHPTAVAFKKGYVIYNPSPNPIEVGFSNGKNATAPHGLSTSKR